MVLVVMMMLNLVLATVQHSVTVLRVHSDINILSLKDMIHRLREDITNLESLSWVTFNLHLLRFSSPALPYRVLPTECASCPLEADDLRTCCTRGDAHQMFL